MQRFIIATNTKLLQIWVRSLFRNISKRKSKVYCWLWKTVAPVYSHSKFGIIPHPISRSSVRRTANQMFGKTNFWLHFWLLKIQTLLWITPIDLKLKRSKRKTLNTDELMIFKATFLLLLSSSDHWRLYSFTNNRDWSETC